MANVLGRCTKGVVISEKDGYKQFQVNHGLTSTDHFETKRQMQICYCEQVCEKTAVEACNILKR